jgi:hypothetical protein
MHANRAVVLPGVAARALPNGQLEMVDQPTWTDEQSTIVTL